MEYSGVEDELRSLLSSLSLSSNLIMPAPRPNRLQVPRPVNYQNAPVQMHRDQLLADASLFAGTQRLCIFPHSPDEIQTRRASRCFQMPHQCLKTVLPFPSSSSHRKRIVIFIAHIVQSLHFLFDLRLSLCYQSVTMPRASRLRVLATTTNLGIQVPRYCPIPDRFRLLLQHLVY